MKKIRPDGFLFVFRLVMYPKQCKLTKYIPNVPNISQASQLCPKRPNGAPNVRKNLTPCLVLPVIAFNKRLFCKYFEKGENNLWFHQFIARVLQLSLQAPTSEVAKLIQDNIVAKLIMKGNFCVTQWCDET